jgi:hypothetical protein
MRTKHTLIATAFAISALACSPVQADAFAPGWKNCNSGPSKVIDGVEQHAAPAWAVNSSSNKVDGKPFYDAYDGAWQQHFATIKNTKLFGAFQPKTTRCHVVSMKNDDLSRTLRLL